jgi:hypothetical protein
MRQRGRKSLATLAAPVGVVTIDRPSAPLDLTPEEAIEWEGIVAAMPADWFSRENWPLLTQYCRHTVSARRIAQLIDAETARQKVDVETMRELLALQARESSILRQLAASMRLAQQARYSAQGAAGASERRTISRPWEAIDAE